MVERIQHTAMRRPPNRGHAFKTCARCVTRDTRVSRICPPIAKTRDRRARVHIEYHCVYNTLCPWCYFEAHERGLSVPWLSTRGMGS